MMRHLNTNFGYVLLYYFLLIGGFSGIAFAGEDYHEYLEFHVGRNSYIAGEQIFYTVYCFSDDKDANFYSKVFYIELIDKHKKSILAQVLQNENNTASSVFQLPDTLSTGVYYLKAYTQWMKNSGEETFGSYPVYIYNQYDEASETYSAFSIPIEAEINIEGGRLITALPARLRLRIPGLMGKKLGIVLRESYSLDTLQSAVTDEEGYAEFEFTPLLGKKYDLITGQSAGNMASFELPPVEYSGYSIRSNLSEKGELTIVTDGSNNPPAQLKLKILAGDNILWEKQIHTEYFKKEINTQYIPGYGCFKIEITDVRDNLLTDQTILISPVSIVKSAESQYSTKQQVNIKFDLSSLVLEEKSGLSVSVHKIPAYRNTEVVLNNAVLSHEKILPDRELLVVFPRYYPTSKIYIPGSVEYVAEDMGLIYSGKAVNNSGNGKLKNLQLALAIRDSMGVIVAATTDSTGHFAMLLNEYGDKEANIFLSFEGIPLNGNNISIDEKYYYRTSHSFIQSPVSCTYDSLFIGEMKDEAQRVLIQRAFRNNGLKAKVNADSSMISQGSFYGEPDIVVYPGEFFFLPNFEEICREILPRVRYKHTKDKCEVIVFHNENGLRSENPIVLVDGICITDCRELYNLNSDDIQRIEVQSGPRVAGQLYYDGLVAIYTTKKYKSEKEKVNKDERKKYPIPGYVNSDEEYLREYDEQAGYSGVPDFTNQLYWNPMLLPDNNGEAEISFNTSDEEGEYVIDITGFTDNGVTVNYKEYFSVTSKK